MGVIGGQGDGLLQVLYGSSQVGGIALQKTALDPGRCVVRCDPDGFVEVLECAGSISRKTSGVTTSLVQAWISWHGGDRSTEVGDGILKVSGLDPEGCPPGANPGLVRLEADQPVEFLEGAAEVSGFEPVRTTAAEP